MKQGTLITKAVIALIFLAIIAYIGFSAFHGVFNPFETVRVYTGTIEDTQTLNGWIVRDELVLPSVEGLVNLRATENEKLAKGQVIALTYRDELSMGSQENTRTLTNQLSSLNYALADNSPSGTVLEEQLQAGMCSLRSAAGDYESLIDDAAAFKGLILRREYLYAPDVATAMGLASISLGESLTALQNSVHSSSSNAVYASQSGVFSTRLDGFESVFTSQSISPVSVSKLKNLAAQHTQSLSSVGKLVTSSQWYYAAILEAEHANRFAVGTEVSLRFASVTTPITMNVTEISAIEDGSVAILFSGNRALSDVIGLRAQSAEAVFRQNTGIRVPKQAVRVLEDNAVGVYTVTGYTAEFKPVSILAESEDFYLLAANPKNADDKRILRPGDEVILATTDLYDGKVVR
ncbi:MAG: HlyD family efflux transporter periplasmic adaptor subunit [Evtepia sp.]